MKHFNTSSLPPTTPYYLRQYRTAQKERTNMAIAIVTIIASLSFVALLIGMLTLVSNSFEERKNNRKNRQR